VPVTVKFSQRFYQKFGHEAVDEMVNWFNQVDTTYRADLRELNELNFARFDAKLEQRIAEVRVELREGLAGLRAELQRQLADQNKALVRWMIGLWLTGIGTLGGLMVVVLRLP
jgi:hypothetical protein